MVRFKYFEAPENEMTGLLEGIRECSICGESGRCFQLDCADPESLPDACLKDGVGCYTCLRKGRFEFFHTTEIGYLFASGPEYLGPELEEEEVTIVSPQGEPVGMDVAPPVERPTVPGHSAIELRRTPGFPTWNEVDWLVHCGDFMVFLGPWQPIDFNRQAENGLGKDVFLSSVDSCHSDFWPADSSSNWEVCCFVFRCTKCGSLRAVVDHS